MHTFLFDRVIKWAGSPLNYAFYDINAKVSHKFSDRAEVGSVSTADGTISVTRKPPSPASGSMVLITSLIQC